MASNRALLVAVNNYGSQQNNLPSCLEDASQFRSLLSERYGFADFKEFYDADASVANVEEGLAWLFDGVTPDDRLVFFYSGHGFQQPRDGNLEECLVLSDLKFLFDDRLSELSQNAPPGVLTVVLDSCFSGGMQKRVALDGRVEIARTKAWMPPPSAMLQQQKALIGRPLVPRPFGCWQVTSPAGVKQLVLGRGGGTKGNGAAPEGEDEAEQLALNGLLLSACSENETASASTSATEGMSAFSFALHQAIGSGNGEISAADLHEGARAKLQEMGFQQTPLLKVPSQAPDLAAAGFVMLASSGQTTPGQPAKGLAPDRQPAPARPAPNGAMPATGSTPAEAVEGSRPTRQGAAASQPRQAAGSGATQAGAQPPARPATGTAQLQAGAETATAGEAAPPQQRGTSTAADVTTRNTATEEMEGIMDPTMQQNDEKWLGLAAGLAASVVPQVISAIRRRKDFAEDSAGNSPMTPSAPPASDAEGEDKWVAALARVAIPAAIQAVPGIINAIRGRKDFEAEAPVTANAPIAVGEPDPGGDEKFLPLAVGIAASLIPEVVRAVRGRKDFAPDFETGTGAASDAEDKWVAALARVAVPAAIHAVPGIINAIRGKDMHILPYPAQPQDRPAVPPSWQRPATGSGGARPRKDFAADALDEGETGEEKRMREVAGGIATEVIRSLTARRSEARLT